MLKLALLFIYDSSLYSEVIRQEAEEQIKGLADRYVSVYSHFFEASMSIPKLYADNIMIMIIACSYFTYIDFYIQSSASC